MSEENKALVRRFFEESNRRKALAEEFLAPDFQAHFPGAAPIEASTFKQHIDPFYAAVKDASVTIEDVLSDGDKVAVRVVQRGTHTGEFSGVPGTGRPIALSNTIIGRIALGKIAEWWPSPDMMGFLEQIGALHAPGKA